MRITGSDNTSTATSSTTLLNTLIACVAAGLVTYPFDQLHTKWQTKALAKWDPQQSYDDTISRSPIRRVISPLSRLVLQEASLAFVVDPQVNKFKKRETLSDQVTAGIISGVAVALLLCPLEAHRAVKRKNRERQNSFKYWIQSLLPQGRADPKERLQRAYGGIGLLAAREVAYNVTFFPLVSYLRKKDGWTSSNKVNLVLCNVLAGAMCSFTVLPLDVWRTYMWHSGERWSLWSGKHVVAPPLSLLYRGWTIQAFILGPAFGLVASIYDLT